jgi:hypothetical protein
MPRGLDDLAKIHQASAAVPEFEKIVLGMGAFGTPTRILPEKFGTLLSYTTPGTSRIWSVPAPASRTPSIWWRYTASTNRGRGPASSP